LAGWADKPIGICWGPDDLPSIIGQNQQAVSLLRSQNFSHFSVTVIPGGRHEPHRDLVMKWMEQQEAISTAR